MLAMVLAWVSGSEIVVAGLVGLLLFGGRLPEVAKDFGRVLFRLRRSMDDLRRESGIDETLRELERESRDLNRDVYIPPKAIQPDLEEPQKQLPAQEAPSEAGAAVPRQAADLQGPKDAA